MSVRVGHGFDIHPFGGDGPLVEPTLLMLSRDQGKGTRIEVTDGD